MQAIGPYRIVRELGRGGMGVVYEAWDDRLARAVAIKTVLGAEDATTRERFIREARAAAAVSHPHICQLFDIGEAHGQPFLCMELLQGQSLADRLAAGALPLPEATATALAILSALAALHRRGIVHRDLKPSNVFLSSNGVKLLDFGVARDAAASMDETGLTAPGLVMGSPRYMSPEQVRGQEVDGRTDIFAAGLLLFEMLSGRPAFGGTSAVDVLHAIAHEHPPALLGSPAVADLDRIVQKAVAKLPGDRFQTADEMATDLRASLSRTGTHEPVDVRSTLRLVALPFKVLRPDPEVDFLAYSLPDAVTVALSAIESLTVRSSLAAARFAGGVPDLRALSSELGVDAAITGTLLHAGNAVRVAVQLIEVPSGTVRWSRSAQVALDDLFSIQDSVCAAVVEAFALPVSRREQDALRQEAPANAEAYEHYLRANRLSTAVTQWPAARDLYVRALDADPAYAPAWARLGRVLRNLAKYGQGDETVGDYRAAEDAFRRAFELSPDLSLAHHYFTHLEVETGRALDAVLRLLGRLRTRSTDPNLFAGLVHACRYVGLLDASIAAYHRATRLDPAIPTSVSHTFYAQGQYERAIACDADELPYVSLISYVALGQRAEAERLCASVHRELTTHPNVEMMIRLFDSVLTNQPEDGRRALEALTSFPAFRDPEGWYYWAQGAALLGDGDWAIRLLRNAVEARFSCPRALETTPLFDSLRGSEEFARLLARSRERHQEAVEAFTRADGHRLLGLPR